MVKLTTPKAALAMLAPKFNLLGIDEKYHGIDDFKDEEGLIVIFLCNHCPYVQKIIDQIVTDAKSLQEKNFKVIGIMPNDVSRYPQDSLENMKNFAQQKGFTFPYVIDSDQTTAKKYGAVCTPDFFGFDKNLKLIYRGRLRSPNGNIRELFNYMTDNSSNAVQHPSEGCSIKWIE